MNSPLVGIIGGSGLYQLDELTERKEVTIETPFGSPSDDFVQGKLADRDVVFVPRHGRGHRLLPTEINHRANMWALRSLGVRFVICVTAVGSLQEDYHPGDILIPDQYYDRTSNRAHQTFFGKGIVAHVSPSAPYSDNLSKRLAETANEAGYRTHLGGTYLNMDGPAFSSKAESIIHRQLGCDVIGMTNIAEAKLAREAEIALATLAMVTDYDCWKPHEEAVTASAAIEVLQANVVKAKEIICKVISKIPTEADWPEHSSLANALATPKDFWPKETIDRLLPLLTPYL